MRRFFYLISAVVFLSFSSVALADEPATQTLQDAIYASSPYSVVAADVMLLADAGDVPQIEGEFDENIEFESDNVSFDVTEEALEPIE